MPKAEPAQEKPPHKEELTVAHPFNVKIVHQNPKTEIILREMVKKKKLGWGEWEEEKNLKWAKNLLQKDWVPETRATS